MLVHIFWRLSRNTKRHNGCNNFWVCEKTFGLQIGGSGEEEKASVRHLLGLERREQARES